MSRLDSFIRRMTAQRDIIAEGRRLVGERTGPVIEFGLGNGRTFDHLRESFPGRRVIAFDRALAAHPSSIPPEGDLVLGEITATAAGFKGIGAVFIHADLGTGQEAIDRVIDGWLPALALDLLAPGGIAASSTPLVAAGLEPLPLPAGVAPGRYYLARKA